MPAPSRLPSVRRMGIVLIWAIGVVLVMAVAATVFRSYRKSRVPPPHAQHPPRRKRPKRHKR
jgi:hypothetical protein